MLSSFALAAVRCTISHQEIGTSKALNIPGLDATTLPGEGAEGLMPRGTITTDVPAQGGIDFDR